MKNKKILIGSIVTMVLIIGAAMYATTQNNEDFYAKYDIEEHDLKKLVASL